MMMRARIVFSARTGLSLIGRTDADEQRNSNYVIASCFSFMIILIARVLHYIKFVL